MSCIGVYCLLNCLRLASLSRLFSWFTIWILDHLCMCRLHLLCSNPGMTNQILWRQAIGSLSHNSIFIYAYRSLALDHGFFDTWFHVILSLNQKHYNTIVYQKNKLPFSWIILLLLTWLIRYLVLYNYSNHNLLLSLCAAW